MVSKLHAPHLLLVVKIFVLAWLKAWLQILYRSTNKCEVHGESVEVSYSIEDLLIYTLM